MLGRLRLRAVRAALRTQLWPQPAIGISIAVALGVGLPRLDARVDHRLPPAVTAFLFGGGAGAAQKVLEAITGSLITVTSLTFSLTVVTLQLASSQFSPRLLRTFTRDRFVHVTLALFLGTFTYALTVLRSVRTYGVGQQAFVPALSVTVAFLLTLASALALVLFLAHLAQEIRVETTMRNVHRQAQATFRAVLSEGSSHTTAVAPAPRPDAVPLLAVSSGFLVGLDEEALLRSAVQADAVVLIDRHPGSSLVAGTPVGCAWPRTGRFDPAVWQRLRQDAPKGLTTSFERTEEQDVGFGLRQLTDVVTKALSPGVNDPTTAVHGLSHVSALLCELVGRDLGTQLLCDEQGLVRVVLRRPELSDLLEMALTQPRRYGAADPAVQTRLLVLLREVGWCVQGPEQRRAVLEQLRRLQATTAAQDFDRTDQDRLDSLARQVAEALANRWAPDTSPP